MSVPGSARRPGSPGVPLLVVVDPVARLTDGESVRIARDVLCAGSPGVKICLPEHPEETARVLARRGSRRPVLVGNDRALLRAVQLLHREQSLASAVLAVVPVGSAPTVALARGLGVPADAVSAARAVLAGTEHWLDLLVDDGGEVVLGGLHIPATTPQPVHRTRRAGADGASGGVRDREQGRGRERRGQGAARDGVADGYGEEPRGADDAPAGSSAGSPWRRACRTLARTVLPLGRRAYGGESGDRRRGSDGGGGPATGVGAAAVSADGGGGDGAAGGGGEGGGGGGDAGGRGAGARAADPLGTPRRGAPQQRLRIEADGRLLADPDHPVEGVSVRTTDEDGGLAEITVRPGAAPALVRAQARAVTVSGAEFRYRADTRVGGPVEVRTWTVLPRAWRLILPHDPPPP